ncbi:ArsR family transcriptional regulator [Candidatus Woesearchaeota archaeon]|nr:ArsR family transcriptional regulator [Candidatus Woesearchaeota archaeon]
MKSKNQETKSREFHIDAFPSDRIFVYLREDFHKKIFSRIKKYKFKEFNNQFFSNRLNWSTFKQWKRRKTDLNFRIKIHFIPLWFIIKLSKIFPEFSIAKFEKNIISIKGPSSSSIIQNPALPLKEDERLIKIVAHFLGDGSVGGGFGSLLPKGKTHSEYRNFSLELLDSFERDLSIFGEVPTTKNYQSGYLIIPNLIGYVLSHIYNIKFDTFNSRVPKRLFELPKELVASFLRAFADDEGHVYDSNIDYYSTNRELLQDILFLMNKNFTEIKTSKIKANFKAGKNIKYSFTIYHSSQKTFLNLIGFDHNQKRKDLIFNLTRRKNKSNRNPKQKILKLLENNNFTAKQISRLLNIRHSTASDYLRELRDLGKVKLLKKENWSNIWTINKR